jgi:tetratricopeptide (TPR) repeat protein/predicted Ser/Thr protein kinase
MMEIGVDSGIEQLTDPDSKSFPEGPEDARSSRTPSATAASRTVIGRYRILRLIGEGGMGVVYEAEQDQPRRTVALKVIKPGLASPELLRRFEQESQALGRLQHPGIAQIYDAGTADTGFGPQPYFAMEFIHGKNVKDYAEERHLNTRQRLEMVAKIAEAVHHAHQRGLIHRDLKPANILVDETGQPKILDFGVARALDSDTQATSTDIGQLVGTLGYMSPEQVLGDPLGLDTRSDVYALGVIVYELLAERLPYTLTKNLEENLRTIREAQPPRLGAVNRSYRGDIETIAAKAVEKDKTRRYASAAAMAEDIRRYLRNEAITARPPGVIYQLQKFTCRHKALVAGIAVVLIVLIAGIIGSTSEATRAKQAEHAALRERDRATLAEQAATQERDRALSAQKSATLERNRAIAAEAQSIQERNRALAEKQRADTEAATARAVNGFLRNDLLAQAAARTHTQPDSNPDPDLTVRTALDRAAARIDGRFNTQPMVEASIRLTVGNAYNDLGLYPDAQQHLERALALQTRILGENDPSTLGTMYDLADDLYLQSKYERAESLLIRVLEIRRRTLGEEHPLTLDSMVKLGGLYRYQGKDAQADALFSKALPALRRILGEAHHLTLRTMNGMALLRLKQGKLAEADALLTQSLEGFRRLLGEEHGESLIVTKNLASLYRDEGKSAEAELLYTRDMRETMADLSLLYHDLGRFAEAEPLLSKFVELNRRLLGDDAPNTVNAMVALARVYQAEGKYAEAELLSTKVLEIHLRVLGEDHPYTRGNMIALADLYSRQGKFAEAEALRTKLVEIARRLVGPEDPYTLARMNELARVYQAEGKYAEAEALDRMLTQVGRTAKNLQPALSLVIRSRNTSSAFVGSWQIDFEPVRQPIFIDLRLAETEVTGAIQFGGEKLSVVGSVNEKQIRFNFTTPDNSRTISLTGQIKDDEIAFTRVVTVRPGGVPGGPGFFGALGSRNLIARRTP